MLLENWMILSLFVYTTAIIETTPHHCVPVCFTYTDYVHEAIHAVAYLEEQVLSLPFRWGTERRPYQPGDAGDEKQRAQDNGCNLHSLNNSERDGLPLQKRQSETQKWTESL